MIVDFINVTFDLINKDKFGAENDIKRFQYVLESTYFLNDIREKSSEGVGGIYNEILDPEDEEKRATENEEIAEEANAYDISNDRDELDNYDPDTDTAFDYQSAIDSAIEVANELASEDIYNNYMDYPV